MKQTKLWLATIAALLCSLTASAHDFEVDGIYYNIISANDLTVEVTSGDNYYSGDVIIPSTINYSGKTMTVTSIGWFRGCSELTSITIPNSVTSIGGFEYCEGPIDIVLESGNTVYDNRNNCNAIIETNSNTLIAGFSNTTIPNSVTSIGNGAFKGCSGLTSITIPNSVTSIGNSAFSSCSGLTSIAIPNSVISIGGAAFCDCTRLTDITIPNSVTSIGSNAFAYCSSLTSITIPNSVTSIGNSAFENSGWWNNQQNGLIYKDGWLIGYKDNRPVFDIVIQDGTKRIANYALYGCSGVTSVTIPNSVISIGEYAFYGCSGLTSIIIPDGVTSIGERAFEGCSGLTSVTIPNSITNLDGTEFFRCDAIEKLELNCPTIESWFSGQLSIKEVVIGNSVTSIGENAFWNCSELTSVTIGNSITSIGRNAFSGCSELTSITIPNSVTKIGAWAFTDCLELTNITIPNSVTSIGEYALSGSGLISVTIGNGVLDIGNGAFFRCDAIEKLELNCPTIESWFSGQLSIKEVVIGNSVTSIGENAFSGCSGLTSVAIGNSVTSISNSAFRDCSGLTSITIPNSVISIGEYAFRDCSGLTNVTIANSVTNIGYRAFDGCNAIEKLELNCPTIESWFYGMPFVKEVVIGNSVTSIGNSAFAYCSRLTSVTVGDSVTSIGNSAFYNCSGLTKIIIPNGVSSVGEGAFEGTAWYNNQPDGTVYAGKVLYKYKGTIPENTDITIAEGTLGITGGAFQHCSGLTSITIPNSMSNIGKNAFWDCYALKKINSFIPAENLFVPDDYAFEGVNKETCTLYVPEGDVSAYQSTAGWNEFEHIVDFDPHFTIIYVVDGEVYSTETAEYGSEVLLIDEPIREGHTFSGWSEVPKTMPANDVTVYGTFTANKYLITFKIDDEVIFSAPIEYGTSIVVPEAPEKDGYSFDGWIEMPETMPAHDVIVYGTFTKLKVETIVINDSDFSFSMEENTECGEIIYTRTFNNTDWQALYIPFEITYEDICDDFEIADINNVHQYDHNEDGKTDETIIEAFKVTDGTLEANYPYLIRAKEAGEKTIVVTDVTLYATEENSIDCSSVREKFTFTGTYSSLSYAELPQSEGYYTLIEGEWQPVTEAMALGAFRFYLKVDNRSGAPAAEARSIRMRIIGENGEDDATGIDNLESPDNDGKTTVIYDLQGRKVLNTETVQGGVYIINGKKVVIK